MAKTKTSRESFMFTPQLSEILQSGADDLDISKNELTSIAIFEFLQNSNNFIICPACKKKICIKQTLPEGSPIIEMPCKCGSVSWYDADNEIIVKTNAA